VDLLPVVLQSKTGGELKAYSPVFIHNCLKVHRLVQELLSVETWQSDGEMLQCAADDYASTMHEADRWCRLGRDSGYFDATARSLSVTYLLDISTDDLVACLASQGVKFVKRFRFKSSDFFCVEGF